MKETIVQNQAAIAEFDRLCDCLGFEIEAEELSEEEKQSLEKIKKKIIKNIEYGFLVINEKGEPTYTPQRSDDKTPITFYEPKGDVLMAADRGATNAQIEKTYAAMAAMTKTNIQVFSKMKLSDLGVCLALLNLFLGFAVSL